ncbi:hypothetical protein D3C87_2159330 [compost metagenome]
MVRPVSFDGRRKGGIDREGAGEFLRRHDFGSRYGPRQDQVPMFRFDFSLDGGAERGRQIKIIVVGWESQPL